ncbi:hypothetical protein GCM10009533_67220 [Saccharopolyspora spinosporotrichia]|uniref:Uncharacterized protein n=1 Tax=Saccharopolyspora erythraea TaxID=1836 RepID=A0ABN1E7G7_SACER
MCGLKPPSRWSSPTTTSVGIGWPEDDVVSGAEVVGSTRGGGGAFVQAVTKLSSATSRTAAVNGRRRPCDTTCEPPLTAPPAGGASETANRALAVMDVPKSPMVASAYPVDDTGGATAQR